MWSTPLSHRESNEHPCPSKFNGSIAEHCPASVMECIDAPYHSTPTRAPQPEHPNQGHLPEHRSRDTPTRALLPEHPNQSTRTTAPRPVSPQIRAPQPEHPSQSTPPRPPLRRCSPSPTTGFETPPCCASTRAVASPLSHRRDPRGPPPRSWPAWPSTKRTPRPRRPPGPRRASRGPCRRRSASSAARCTSR